MRDERTPSTPITSVEVDIARQVADAEGHVLQEGDPEIYRGGTEVADADERWKAAIARAYEVQRSIGRIPLSLERLVKKILESKVDWRALLRNSLKVGIGRFVVSTWKRPSRKSDEYPGLRKFSNPTVWCLIDTSGSISDEELEQFLGEVYAVAGEAPVAVVCWDAKVYDVIKARSRQEVITNVSSKVKGGGGTVIEPALRKLLDNMKPRDAVIIFSDFFIDDLESDRVKQLLSEVAQRASVAIACSVHRDVQIDGWRFVNLEL